MSNNQNKNKNNSTLSFRPSSQLEDSLMSNLANSSRNRPVIAAGTSSSSSGGGATGGGGTLRFQSMSGRGRTRREEAEAALENGGEQVDEVGIEDGEEGLEGVEEEEEDDDSDDDTTSKKKKSSSKGKGKGKEKEKNLNKRNSGSVGRRKISMSFIEEKARRTVTFTKRKSGLMKKAFELSTLTGTDCLVVVVSESGLVYTFATPSLKGVTESEQGKEVISLALKGELMGDATGETERGSQVKGKRKDSGKERDSERERSGSALVVENNNNNNEDLYVGLIDPSLPGPSSNDLHHHHQHQRQSTSHSPFLPPPPLTSTGSPSYPFPPDLGLPFPPQTSTSFASNPTNQHDHSQLSLPPLSLPMDPDHSHPTHSQQQHYPFFFNTSPHPLSPHSQLPLPAPPPPPQLPIPSTSTVPYDPVTQGFSSSSFGHLPDPNPSPPPPSEPIASEQVGNQERVGADQGAEEESPYAKAVRIHQVAFEQYQARANFLGNKIPPPPPLNSLLPSTCTSTVEGEGNVEGWEEEESGALGGTRKRTNEQELGGRGEEARGAQGGEKSQGGNELKKRRLGASDFGNAAIEWEKRIRERANVTNSSDASGSTTTTKTTRRDLDLDLLGSGGPNPTGIASMEGERQGTESVGVGRSESQFGAGRGGRASLVGGGASASGSRIQDLEERRRFWRERVGESVSNAKNSPSITRFLHAHFLSILASSTIPPSLPIRDSSTGQILQDIENIPEPTPNAVTFGEFKLFVESKRLEGFVKGEELGAVIDWFLLDQEEKAGSTNGPKLVGTMKQHLIGWFDFLEGHGLIDEEQYMDLAAFGDTSIMRGGGGGRGRGKRVGEMMRERIEGTRCAA